MSASNDWSRKFCNHNIFEIVRQHEELRKKSAVRSTPVKVDTSGRSAKPSRNGSRLEAGPVDAQSLLVVKDGEVFLWDSYTLSVLTTNLKALAALDSQEGNTSERLTHQVNDDGCFCDSD